MAQRKAENHILDIGEISGPALWKAVNHSGLRRKGVLRCFIPISRKAKQRRCEVLAFRFPEKRKQ